MCKSGPEGGVLLGDFEAWWLSGAAARVVAAGRQEGWGVPRGGCRLVLVHGQGVRQSLWQQIAPAWAHVCARCWLQCTMA